MISMRFKSADHESQNEFAIFSEIEPPGDLNFILITDQNRTAYFCENCVLSQKDAIDLAQAILKHYEVLQPDPERDEIIDEGEPMPEEMTGDDEHEMKDFGTW